MTDKHRGVAEFPLVPGAVIRFTLGDLAKLREQFGPQYEVELRAGLDRYDPIVLTACLRYGLKNEADGKTYFPTHGEGRAPAVAGSLDLSDPPFPFSAAITPVLNGLFLALTGKSFVELAAESESAGPLDEALRQAIVSDISTEPAPAQASTLTSSGE